LPAGQCVPSGGTAGWGISGELPGACGAGGTAGDCFTLDVERQSASAGSDGDWALETSLDVEWAHAIAPRATIVLIETADDSFASLFSGVQTATRLSPASVSMSWGIDETLASRP
jgi:hypothetical protein